MSGLREPLWECSVMCQEPSGKLFQFECLIRSCWKWRVDKGQAFVVTGGVGSNSLYTIHKQCKHGRFV